MVTQPTGFVALPGNSMATTLRGIANRAAKYNLVTWLPAEFPGTGEITSFGGTGENEVRPPAAAAFGLACLLATGQYDATIVGVSEADAKASCLRLVRALANLHVANGGTWGGAAWTPPNSAGGGVGWQTGMWAFLGAAAGWFLWDDLSTQLEVERMIAHEADRMLVWDLPFWVRRDGSTAYEGDSKIEEIAWNAAAVAVAAAMLPDHDRAGAWMEKLAEMGVAAGSRPSDLTSGDVVNGFHPSETLNGYNVNEDGTVINHGIVHPDYMASPSEVLWGVLSGFAAAGLLAPVGALHGAGPVWRAFSSVFFASPPYDSPGGTIYIPGSEDFYYPEGNDWGTERTMNRALSDVLAWKYGFDVGHPTTAESWAELHLNRQAGLQARGTSGQTYYAPEEATHPAREQLILHYSGMALLAMCTPAVALSDDTPTRIAVANEQGTAPPPAGLSLEAVTAPVPGVGVVVAGLDAVTSSVVTVERSVAGEDWEAVPGFVARRFTAATYDVDYTAPLGVPVTYRIVVLAGDVVPSTTEATITLPGGTVWLQDPVNPLTAVEVSLVPAGDMPVLGEGSFRKFTRQQASERVSILGARRGVSLAGTRQAPSEVPFSVLTFTPAQTSRLLVLLDTAHPLVVRTPPHVTGMAATAALAVTVTDTRYDDDPDDEAGLVVEWVLVGDEVRPSRAAVVVPRWTYAQVNALWPGTYADAIAAGGRYLDWLRDPTRGVV